MHQRFHKTFEVGDGNSGAVFDRRRQFRYHLWRVWDKRRPRVCFLMLNPSAADESRNDPTIARCVSFARSWNFGALHVVNAFAYRTHDSSLLSKVRDPVGPANDRFIYDVVQQTDMLVLAWGNHGAICDRDAEVITMLPEWVTLYCLGMTKQGQPRHPLYVPGDAKPVRFIL